MVFAGLKPSLLLTMSPENRLGVHKSLGVDYSDQPQSYPVPVSNKRERRDLGGFATLSSGTPGHQSVQRRQ